jgi:RHS repeat-associated protein
LTSRTEANGIVTTVTYTGTDQLASKTEVAGSTTLASWTSVSYDLDQNRTAETLTYYAGNPYPDPQSGTPSGSASSTYQYDTLDQLSQATLPSVGAKNYGYDAAHNLTSNSGTSQTYNANESLQTVGGATTGSDADGNQLKDVLGNTLSWNSLSQLEAFSTSETYTYDALGRLTVVTNGSNVTKFVYQGLSGRVIQELDSSNVVQRSYAWDGSRQLYVKSGGNAYYQITNPHGDNVAWASASALVGTQHFDPWGQPTYTPTGFTTPFGFQGAVGSWTDATNGFLSMGVRWYYPKTSQFLSSDSAAGTADPRTPIERSRWLYGANDPLDMDDPSGLANAIAGGSSCNASCQAAAAAEAAEAARERRRLAAAEANARARARALALMAAAQAAAEARERRQQAIREHNRGTALVPTKPSSAGSSWLKIGGYDVGQHFGNAWNQAQQIGNVRPDTIGIDQALGTFQDPLIAAGNQMDSGWRQRYTNALSASGNEIGREHDALMSGDPKQWATVPAVDTLAVGVMLLGCAVACAPIAAYLAETAAPTAMAYAVMYGPQVTAAGSAIAYGLADPGYNAPTGASSRLLARNLETSGIVRPAASAAHHIVAGGADAAAEGRSLLKNFGIGINSAANGAFLPRFLSSVNPQGAVVHSVVHTMQYYDTVNRLLTKAESGEEALAVLGYIRDRLLSGQMPV